MIIFQVTLSRPDNGNITGLGIRHYRGVSKWGLIVGEFHRI